MIMYSIAPDVIEKKKKMNESLFPIITKRHFYAVIKEQKINI